MRRLAIVALVACSAPAPRTQIPDRPPTPPPATKPLSTAGKAVETPVLIAAPLPNDPTKTTIHRLSNGMTVYLSPDPQVPQVVAHIAVRAGARNDPRQSTGLAHYLEHMMFKGTSALGSLDYAREKPHLDKIATLYAELRRGNDPDRDRILTAIDTENQDAAAFAVPNELDQLYARMGMSGLNAETTSDATVYTVEVPRNRLAQWARVEAQRFGDPVFRLLWPELEAVYEEKNSALDDPDSRVEEAMLRALWPEHGYGWNGGVLGEVEHLKSPAYQDMLAFFQRYYTPQNMAIVLAGDVDASVLPLLEQELGGFKRPAGDLPEPGTLVKSTAQRTAVEVAVPSDEGVVLAWPTVAATHPDALAVELMDRLLLDGDYGMLARELLITQKVETARSEASFMREAGYFMLAADALDGQTHAQLEALLLGLVDKLQRGEFTDTELATAVLTYDVAKQQQLETNDGRAALLTDAFVLGEDWHDVAQRVERMRRLTKADIVRVAKQYLTRSYVIVEKHKGTSVLPKITKPPITPVKLDPSRQTVFAKSILAMPVSGIDPVAIADGVDYKRGALPTGELVAVPNRRNGLFALAFDYDFGRADDRLACLAIGSLDVAGAGRRSADDMARALHELGVSLDTACTKDETRISLSGPDANLEAALALVRERFAEPTLDAATVGARVATALTERANALANPQAIQGAQVEYALRGADSEELVVPTNAQLRAVQPAQLQKLIRRYLTMAHRTSYFGPRTFDQARSVVAFGDGTVATKPPRAVRYRTAASVFATHQVTAQTHVSIAWPRKPTADGDRALGTLFASYADPMLYQEVRESRGLAYTVFGTFNPGGRKQDDSSVLVYAGVQADKTHDAIDAVTTALHAPIDDKRLDLAKETLNQGYRIERITPRAIAPVVYAWLDQGETADPRAARMARALAVDKAALGQWLTGVLARPPIISIVGDKQHVDAKKLGTVTWVPASKLFGY